MISTVAQLLEELRAAEEKILKKVDIQHGPTIGSMYEGLTREILSRGVPSSLGLKVVEGFIKGVDNKKSHQADVMLVKGEGTPIPHTTAFIWDIRNVLAVFEVKKNLFGAELEDAFSKMWKVAQLFKECDLADGYDGKDIAFAHKTFAKLTGYYPPYSDVDALPAPLPTIHYATTLEQLVPVRIILGYEGYANERTLRKGIADFIASKGTGPDRGFISLPSLIMCRSNAVIKLNGFPYFYPLQDYLGWWEVMGSNAQNPTRLLLEMLWTKISAEMDVNLPMDDTLSQEEIYPLLRHRFAEKQTPSGVQRGFKMEYLTELPPPSSRSERKTWAPESTSELESVTLWQAARRGYVDLADADFAIYAAENGTTSKDVVATLVKKRMLGWLNSKHERARPIEPRFATVFTPSGQTKVSGDGELLGLWLEEELGRTDKNI